MIFVSDRGNRVFSICHRAAHDRHIHPDLVTHLKIVIHVGVEVNIRPARRVAGGKLRQERVAAASRCRRVSGHQREGSAAIGTQHIKDSIHRHGCPANCRLREESQVDATPDKFGRCAKNRGCNRALHGNRERSSINDRGNKGAGDRGGECPVKNTSDGGHAATDKVVRGTRCHGAWVASGDADDVHRRARNRLIGRRTSGIHRQHVTAGCLRVSRVGHARGSDIQSRRTD